MATVIHFMNEEKRSLAAQQSTQPPSDPGELQPTPTI